MNYRVAQYNRRFYQIAFLTALASRGNTVGPIAVTPQSYDTNDGATTITVGASGADYTDLITAYAAASAGDVIELLDDTHALTTRLVCNKGVNGSGKAIKIKGKSTKTTFTLFNVSQPIQNKGAGSAVEFENIIFDENNGNEPFRNVSTANDGFAHFINCDFDGGIHLALFNSKETVFDGVEFTNQVDTEVILLFNDSGLDPAAKIICNDVACDYAAIDDFISHTWGVSTPKIDLISITNSNIQIVRELFTGAEWEVSEIDVRGNIGTNDSVTGILKVGVEAIGAILDHYDVWNDATLYVTGDLRQHSANLWECVIDNEDSEPMKSNSNWKVGEVITGVIENNLFKRVNYVGSGHGLFLGFGSYKVSVQNNIVTNFWWNYVDKGYLNDVQYCCAGEGFRGFALIANNKGTYGNNTSRSESDKAFSSSVQAIGGADVDNTIIRDSIFTNTINGDDLFGCSSLLNTFIQTIFYGDAPVATFDSIPYDLSVPAEFQAFKTAIGDVKAQFIDPEFTGSDPTVEAYYVPRNAAFLEMYDSNYQAVGAVDITKY